MHTKEMLTIYNEEFNEIGTLPRSDVHKKGLLHQVVHCWIIESTATNDWLYFQQRSYDKEDFPGWYDITSAGHIDIGESPEIAVKREAREELGITISTENLHYIGSVRERFKLNDFDDNEYCQVFLYYVENAEFYLGNEVEKMVKVPVDECKIWFTDGLDTLTAFSLDEKSKISIKTSELFFHNREYFEFVFSHIK